MSEGKKITLAEASEIARRSIVDAESRRAEERARDARESACSDCESLRADLARVTTENALIKKCIGQENERIAKAETARDEQAEEATALLHRAEAAESRAEGLERERDAAREDASRLAGALQAAQAYVHRDRSEVECIVKDMAECAIEAHAKSLGERGGE